MSALKSGLEAKMSLFPPGFLAKRLSRSIYMLILQ